LSKFCFQFNRQGTYRTLDKDMVDALLKMTLKGRIADERLETFCAFLEKQESYTRITLDQWTSFLDFCYECEDLSTYDESMSAWPVLIDEYVEYMEEHQKAKK
jgi:Cullin binding